MSKGNFYLYIMASSTKNIFIGVTDDLEEKIGEYGEGNVEKPGCTKLVYYEPHQFNCNAAGRRKQLNGFGRKEIEALIGENNPRWEDLSYKI